MQAKKGRKRLMSEINVTPLVDVMLVLLIIFMVAAPMMTEGVEVNLPQTETKAIKTREDPLILSITKDQSIFLEDQQFSLEGLDEKMDKILANRKNKELLLRADKDVSYGFVIQVIAAVKRGGVESLGMITEPEK